MSQTNKSSRPSVPLLPPLVEDAVEYAVDAWQRGILYTDVMRQRGNQYQRHMSKTAPNVLSMRAELVLDGRTLKRPVNYMLTRIIPPKSMPVDPIKRPFVVVDPRAGHGPGIAGFKTESEIGVAVQAGHPCYFIGFLPKPEPDQGVEDVVAAEVKMLEEVIARHPESEGKPVLVGNCQAGWQIMMAAAIRPDLVGPVLIAGAPLSYWAGWRNMYPMRYLGGLTGGSWMTMMASDLGGGVFDGANLVQNFENLNPANTYWSKQYNLYANVDTEASRYLGFERWWGGHVFLNGKEIQYIVDNLFIGNKLSTAKMVTQDGLRIDLRNIRSPIIVFCSKGDNITPPPQALGWITDLYQSDREVIAHGQTIVYAIHESIGHLGIFVSGSVARKEHREFTCNIDLIDMLPPGIYEAIITDKTPETPNAELAFGDYVLKFERRSISDIQAIVQKREDDERRFATVNRVSQINVGLYKSFLQPWVKMMATERVTERLQQWHPLRLPYEMISDKNPWVAAMAPVSVQVRNHRQPVSKDNVFLQLEKQVSNAIESGLDLWGKWRDALIEQTFLAVYGSPLIQDLAGLGAKEGSPREHPGVSPEHIQFIKRRVAELRELVNEGALTEACVRSMLYISQALGCIDERSFNLIKKLREGNEHLLSLEDFKKMVRRQALVLVVDPEGAIKALHEMLDPYDEQTLQKAAKFVQKLALAGGSLNDAAKQRLDDIMVIFEDAAASARKKVELIRALQQQAAATAAVPEPAVTTSNTNPAVKKAAKKPAAKRSNRKKTAAKVSAKTQQSFVMDVPASIDQVVAADSATPLATPPDDSTEKTAA